MAVLGPTIDSPGVVSAAGVVACAVINDGEARADAARATTAHRGDRRNRIISQMTGDA
jgi:hypothetical protein